MSRVVNTGIFRDVFTFATKDVAHYFPGHMAKGLVQMQRKLKEVDCVIEVHDARIPFTGRNPVFQRTVAIRPHMLVLNKMDLADLRQREKLEQKLKDQGISKVLYTNCKKNTDVVIKKKIIPAVVEMVENSERYNRAKEEDYNVLIIGVPNVGKSSLINALRSGILRKGRATAVGGEAGVTRSVQTKIKVSENPRVFLLDTPGILNPELEDLETGMKLAACANLKDSLVGEELIADYILFWLNKHGIFRYTKHFELPGATDDVLSLLTYIANQRNMVLKRKSIDASQGYQYQPDMKGAATLFVRAFREGHLGKVNLDMDMLQDDQPTIASHTVT